MFFVIHVYYKALYRLDGIIHMTCYFSVFNDKTSNVRIHIHSLNVWNNQLYHLFQFEITWLRNSIIIYSLSVKIYNLCSGYYLHRAWTTNY